MVLLLLLTITTLMQPTSVALANEQQPTDEVERILFQSEEDEGEGAEVEAIDACRIDGLEIAAAGDIFPTPAPFLAALNAERRAAGCSPFRVDSRTRLGTHPVLDRVAREHARYLFRQASNPDIGITDWQFDRVRSGADFAEDSPANSIFRVTHTGRRLLEEDYEFVSPRLTNDAYEFWGTYFNAVSQDAFFSTGGFGREASRISREPATEPPRLPNPWGREPLTPLPEEGLIGVDQLQSWTFTQMHNRHIITECELDDVGIALVETEEVDCLYYLVIIAAKDLDIPPEPDNCLCECNFDRDAGVITLDYATTSRLRNYDVGVRYKGLIDLADGWPARRTLPQGLISGEQLIAPPTALSRQ